MVKKMNESSAPTREVLKCEAPSSLDAVAIDELPLPYMEIDEMGFITRANRATMDLHSLEHGALIGKMVWDLMMTDEKEPACAAYLSLMESGQEPETVMRSLFTRHGEFRTYELHRSLIRNAEGRSAGIRLIGVDVTMATRELDEARRKLLWLESMLTSAPDAVIVTDALGFIRAVNPAAEAMIGWREAELVGKGIEKGVPLLKYASCDGKRLSFNMALEGNSRGLATILGRDRRELEVEIATSPIVDKESGFTNGVLSVIRPVNTAVSQCPDAVAVATDATQL
jgi:PAS domain S-box-containing protein